MSDAISWGAIGALTGEEAEAGAPFGPVGWLIAGVAIVATAVVGAIILNQAVSEPAQGAKSAADSFPKTEAKAVEECQGGAPQPKQEDPEKDELDKVDSLKDLSPDQIADILKKQGYSGPLPGDNGGDIYVKNLPNGRSVRIRVDPAEIRKNPKGWADEKPHVHKEGVDTGANDSETAGKSAKNQVRYDDSGCPSNEPEDVHIPIRDE